MTALKRLSARLPDAPPETLDALLEDAADAICAYTRRTHVPRALMGAQIVLAVVYYNRQGIEGEVSHSASGTVYVNGRVRGRVSGVVDAHIQGVIYGDVSGMLETGSYQTKEVPKADETEKQ